jgi:heme/copper-type cytochrome/quinol oxidase subunit 4
MEKLKKRKVKLIILLAIIWIVVSLPLPWIINNPNVEESQFYTILGIIGIISVPFVVLGVVWTLKPELTT